MGEESKVRRIPVFYELLVGAFLVGLGWIGGAVVDHAFAQRLLDGRYGLLLLLVVIFIVVIVLLREMYNLMITLERKIGIKVRYIANDGKGRVYYSCRKVISKAKSSIHVLHSYLIEGHTDDEKDERERYFNSLLEKAAGGVEYIRILQIKDDGSTLHDLQDDTVHSKHLQAMIERRRGETGSKVVVKRCLARRLTTFVLVDNAHLIWQINNVRFDGGKERMALQGVFIIHDPQGKITEQFDSIFTTLLRGDNADLKWDEKNRSFV